MNLNEIKYKLTVVWDEKRFQMIGMALLIGGVVFAFLRNTVMAYSLLIPVGLLDLYLISRKEQTITNWWRALWGITVDRIILFALFGVTWWIVGPTFALWFLIGWLNSHLNERQ